MKLITIILLSILSTPALSCDMSLIEGKYKFVKYSVTFADGRVLGLKELGAQGVEIEFNKNLSIIMDMTMKDGRVVSTKAKILECEIEGNKGYWIAQWPDMPYPVRKEFKFDGKSFSYSIKFDNKNDSFRYGSVERATLTKIEAF